MEWNECDKGGVRGEEWHNEILRPRVKFLRSISTVVGLCDDKMAEMRWLGLATLNGLHRRVAR